MKHMAKEALVLHYTYAVSIQMNKQQMNECDNETMTIDTYKCV